MTRFGDLHFPGAPRIEVKPPGPKARALLALQEKYESAAVLYPKSLPLALEEAKGSTVRDVDGNLYLDFYAGISVLNFGHSNPAILKAAEAQLRRLTHSLDFPHETRLELIRTLIETAPGRLRNASRVLFGSPSGADAVESALKLARHHRNRYAVISFEGAYHGQTVGALGVGAQTRAKAGLPPLAAETHFAPFPYCYRCPFGKGVDGGNGCCMEPARNLERLLSDPYSGVPEPAAVILEPVQGEGGIVEAPTEFLREVRRITEERGIPLIVDEIQAGLGRTGDLYSCASAISINRCLRYVPISFTWSKSFSRSRNRSPASPAAIATRFPRNVPTCAPGSHASRSGRRTRAASGTTTSRASRSGPPMRPSPTTR